MYVVESEKAAGTTVEAAIYNSYPFRKMQEGDSFQVHSNSLELRRVRGAAYTFHRRNPEYKFSVVRDKLNEGFHRCWRLRVNREEMEWTASASSKRCSFRSRSNFRS